MIYQITFRVIYFPNDASREHNDPNEETYYCKELFEERRKELYSDGLFPHCYLVATYIKACHGDYLYTRVSFTIHDNGILEKSAYCHESGGYERLPEYYHLAFNDMRAE